MGFSSLWKQCFVSTYCSKNSLQLSCGYVMLGIRGVYGNLWSLLWSWSWGWVRWAPEAWEQTLRASPNRCCDMMCQWMNAKHSQCQGANIAMWVLVWHTSKKAHVQWNEIEVFAAELIRIFHMRMWNVTLLGYVPFPIIFLIMDSEYLCVWWGSILPNTSVRWRILL